MSSGDEHGALIRNDYAVSKTHVALQTGKRIRAER